MATGKCISVSCVFVFLYSPTVSSGDKSCVPVQAGIVYYFECKAYIISCKKGTLENYIIDKQIFSFGLFVGLAPMFIYI